MPHERLPSRNALRPPPPASRTVRHAPRTVHQAPRIAQRAPRAAQRGVMLFIALITLAAMALVAVALFRSTDIGTLQAGNLALMNDQANRGEVCVRRAISWLSDPGSGMDPTSGADQPQFNYFGRQFTPAALDARYGIPANMLSQSNNGWMGTAPDIDAGGGVRVNCVIERMCTRTDPADATHCQMAGATISPQGKDASYGGPTVGAFAAFRVTSRIDGLKGTTFNQVTLSPRTM